jgi:ketosteroid isomerase-like protein
MNANEELLLRGFEALCEGNADALQSIVHDDAVLQYPGRGKLAGRLQGHAELIDWLRRGAQYTNGSWRVELVSAIADHKRAVALYVSRLQRNGTTRYDRGMAVFNVRNGKISDIWVTPADLYASDEMWS